MGKKNPLAQVLSQVEPSKAEATSSQPARSGPSVAKPRPKSRTGRSMIGAFFAPEVHKQLRIIAAEEGTTIQELIAEGLNSVFARRRKPEIAGLGRAQ